MQSRKESYNDVSCVCSSHTVPLKANRRHCKVKLAPFTRQGFIKNKTLLVNKIVNTKVASVSRLLPL